MKKYYYEICENMGSIWTLGMFETLKEARQAVLSDRKSLTKNERKTCVHYIGMIYAENPEPDYYGDFDLIF